MMLLKKTIVSLFKKMGLEISKAKEDKWLSDYGIKTILDIGANKGGFAMKIRKIIPHAKIYSFEPIKQALDNLKINLKKDSNIEFFNIGLGNKNSELEINKNEFSPSSSILEMNSSHKINFPHTKKTLKEKIIIKRLDDIIKDIDVKSKLLIKIDVQGYEKEVILGGIKTIPRADIIIVETSFVELYKKQPLFEDIYKILTKLGFKYMGSFEQIKSPLNEQILQQDSIFIK